MGEFIPKEFHGGDSTIVPFMPVISDNNSLDFFFKVSSMNGGGNYSVFLQVESNGQYK